MRANAVVEDGGLTLPAVLFDYRDAHGPQSETGNFHKLRIAGSETPIRAKLVGLST
jgi:hypothetical protein